MLEIIPSYPNKYFKSKHERFKLNDVCMCKCDCDMIMSSKYGYKKGDICFLCVEGDHHEPIYKKEDRINVC